MSTHKFLENELLDAYSKLGTKYAPPSAVRKKYDQEHFVVPSIPFVGKNYDEQAKKILVYASAEVLSDYYPSSQSDRPWLDDNEQAANRHRVRFDDSIEDVNFFPDIHIQPMYDGTLATAVLYIASQYMDIRNQLPREFYERICIGNLIKYTKETERQKNIREGCGNLGSDKNTDITQMHKDEAHAFFASSHPYLKADLDILRPNLIILPQKIYKMSKDFWDNMAAHIGAKVIGIHQLGPTPINCTIPRYHAPKSPHLLHPTFEQWRNNIRRVSQEKYLCVFSYLDEVLSSLKEE